MERGGWGGEMGWRWEVGGGEGGREGNGEKEVGGRTEMKQSVEAGMVCWWVGGSFSALCIALYIVHGAMVHGAWCMVHSVSCILLCAL